jgi:hypothetical protein
MVFTGIEADSLNWRWEISSDGESWTERMNASYTRMP